MAAITTQMIFDDYIKGVSGKDASPTAILNGADNVGIALVGQLDDETITTASDATAFASLIAEDIVTGSAVPCVKAIPANDIELSVSGTGDNLAVKVLASPVSFGMNASSTTINNAYGAIVYVKTAGTPTENSLADFSTSAASTKMVCYLDFGGVPVSSLRGPFQVTFNGGTADGVTKGAIFGYDKSST